MSDEKVVKSLSDFVARVRDIREQWRLDDRDELWFRGEGKKYEKSLLRPKLYRPPEQRRMKPELELLGIEYELYEEFRRCGVQLCDAKLEEGYQDWDWYFLMQHHGGPTRLLDWSDGALIALHFALRDKLMGDPDPAVVYVLEPYQLTDQLKGLLDIPKIREQWKAYKERHPQYKDREDDEWEFAYLPDEEEEREKFDMPTTPLVLEFPHITRRIAAQRSRFVVFGKDNPSWLSDQCDKTDSAIDVISIDPTCIPGLKIELRDNGVTESIIYPDLDGLGREMHQLWEDRK